MFLRAGLEYADDRVTLRCVKVCIPAEQELKENMHKQNQKHLFWSSALRWHIKQFKSDIFHFVAKSWKGLVPTP